MHQRRLHVLVLLLVAVLLVLSGADAKGDDASFQCGGSLEVEVWHLWDRSVGDFLRAEQLERRLRSQGDVYALYDLQQYLHNLVEMARRCQRHDRLQELARLLETAYSTLETNPERKSGMGWICRGGAICNNRNNLLNKEVMLDSVQFLALTTSVANALTIAGSGEDRFVERTMTVSIQHLLRWGDVDQQRRLEKIILSQPTEVRGGSSALFFHDKHLWMIGIYADLAGILQKQPHLFAKSGFSEADRKILREHLRILLKFFLARTSLTPTVGRRGHRLVLGDLDRGFWRLYPDSRYAGYTGLDKPVVCVLKPDSKLRVEIMRDPATVHLVDDIGWDFSHARRLVHVFDSLERNRIAMQEVFRIGNEVQVPPTIIRAFAEQLVERIWNNDQVAPLFTNYWSGTNGWYRVGYDNGTDRCMEGYPPFGLSESFATGGYITWSRHLPVIRQLGRRLYRLSRSSEPEHQRFLGRYYNGLAANVAEHTGALTKIMFLPTLVEAGR